jgi:MOSC domain-containing protein YiiM
MSKIIEIGITELNNKEIVAVKEIDLIAGKGIIGDRHFKDYNDPYNHLSIIESESIDEYNKKYNLSIPYLNFRRNIITRGIKLNDLIDKKILIGDIQLDVIDLCRPCRHLSEKLDKDNIVKEFLRKGGIRCGILNDGKISTGDQVKII